jgi:hypothetical protein
VNGSEANGVHDRPRRSSEGAPAARGYPPPKSAFASFRLAIEAALAGDLSSPRAPGTGPSGDRSVPARRETSRQRHCPPVPHPGALQCRLRRQLEKRSACVFEVQGVGSRMSARSPMWAKLAAQSDREGWPAARFLAALAEHEMATPVGLPFALCVGRQGAGALRLESR